MVKGQATIVLKKATNAGIALEDTLTENPFTAYSHARFGVSISSMEMIAKIASVKIVNPGRTRTMIEVSQGYEIDGSSGTRSLTTPSASTRRRCTWLLWTAEHSPCRVPLRSLAFPDPWLRDRGSSGAQLRPCHYDGVAPHVRSAAGSGHILNAHQSARGRDRAGVEHPGRVCRFG